MISFIFTLILLKLYFWNVSQRKAIALFLVIYIYILILIKDEVKIKKSGFGLFRYSVF